jgi:hypothetical protein
MSNDWAGRNWKYVSPQASGRWNGPLRTGAVPGTRPGRAELQKFKLSEPYWEGYERRVH